MTLACGDYDRTRALADGRVTVEGADLTVLALGPEEIFFRTVRFEEFDVAELSLFTYVLTAQRDAPFVAIPVSLSACSDGPASVPGPAPALVSPGRCLAM
jgi:4,5-dihydroxyphthalate decarboxylase